MAAAKALSSARRAQGVVVFLSRAGARQARRIFGRRSTWSFSRRCRRRPEYFCWRCEPRARSRIWRGRRIFARRRRGCWAAGAGFEAAQFARAWPRASVTERRDPNSSRRGALSARARVFPRATAIGAAAAAGAAEGESRKRVSAMLRHAARFAPTKVSISALSRPALADAFGERLSGPFQDRGAARSKFGAILLFPAAFIRK